MSVKNLPEPGELTRVLVVTKGHGLDNALAFLKRRGYVIQTATNAFLAIKDAQTFKPHVILFSWSSPKINAVKMYELFTKTANAICIVMSESTSRKASTALMATGIPNTMMAPITGPALNMRITTLVKKKALKYAEKKVRRLPAKIEVAVNSLDKLPPDTNWEKLSSASGSEEDTVWSGVHTDKAGNKMTYHIRGEKPPKFNSERQTWENVDLHKLTKVEESPENLNELFSGSDESLEEISIKIDAPEGPSFLSADFNSDLTTAAEDEEFSAEEDEAIYNAQDPNDHDATQKAYQVTEVAKTQNAEKLSLLAHHTKWAVENVVQPNETEAKSLGRVKGFSVAIVESVHFRGYLVCNYSEGFNASALMAQIFEKVLKKMNDSKESMKTTLEVLDLPFPPLDFMAWAEENAEFVVRSQHAEDTVVVAFVPVDSIPEVIDFTPEDLAKINLEDDIAGDTKILFDIYIFLEKNQKYIMYLRRNSTFTQDRIDKLLSFGIQYLYVRKSDLQALQTYWAAVRIFHAA